MGEDVESEEEEEDDDDLSENEDTESADSDDNDTRLSKQTDDVKKKTLKRRVSFKEDCASCDIEKQETDSDEAHCDMIRIAFKHSDTPFCALSDSTDEIVCPSDIYSKYVSHRMPKSILKPSQSVDMLTEDLDTSANDKAEIIKQYIEPAIKVSFYSVTVILGE